MRIADKIKELMQDGPKTNEELSKAIGVNTRIISGTISLNKDIFLRLDKGFIGLHDRDEHLVKVTNFKPKIKLYMKICNLLMDGEKRLYDLYGAMPEEKRVSIRACISMRPDLFIRLKPGLIGRAGRDEYMIDTYKPNKIKKEPKLTLSMCLEIMLLDGPKTLQELYSLLTNYPKNQITCKLSLNKRIERVDKGVYGLKE